MSKSKSVEGGAARALAESIAAVVPLLSARDLPHLANDVLLAGHRALYAYCGDYSAPGAQSLEDAVGRLHAAAGAFEAETRALVERAQAAYAAVASPLVDALREVVEAADDDDPWPLKEAIGRAAEVLARAGVVR